MIGPFNFSKCIAVTFLNLVQSLFQVIRTRLCDGNMVGYSRIIEQSGICLITFNLIDNNVLNFLG